MLGKDFLIVFTYDWSAGGKDVSRSLDMLFREPIVFFTALHGSYARALFYVYFFAVLCYGFTINKIGPCFLLMAVGWLLAVPVLMVTM